MIESKMISFTPKIFNKYKEINGVKKKKKKLINMIQIDKLSYKKSIHINKNKKD